MLVFMILLWLDVVNAHIRATAKAISRRPLMAETWVRSQVGPCGVCGGQTYTVTVLFRVLRFSPVTPLHQTSMFIHSQPPLYVKI